MLGGTREILVSLVFLLSSFGSGWEHEISDGRKAPEIKGITPAAPSAGTVLDIQGFRLGVTDHGLSKIKVHFVQGGAHHITSPSAGSSATNNLQSAIEH